MKIMTSRSNPIRFAERKQAETMGCDYGLGNKEPCEGQFDAYYIPGDGRFILCDKHFITLRRK